MNINSIVFDGFVEEVHDEQVEVRLADGGDEFWTIMQKSMVPEEDRALIAPGAFFKWHVEDGKSVIKFNREVFTQADIDKARADAETLLSGIRWA